MAGGEEHEGEHSANPATGQGGLAAEGGGDPANLSFLQQERIADEQIGVSEAPVIDDLDPKLLAQLSEVPEGGEMSLGTENSPERSGDAIRGELLSKLESEQHGPESESAEAAQEDISKTRRCRRS